MCARIESSRISRRGTVCRVSFGSSKPTRALPAIGATSVSLAPFGDLVAMPGFGTALRLTLVTGLGATALSLLAGYDSTQAGKAFARALSDEESLVRQTAVRRLDVDLEVFVAQCAKDVAGVVRHEIATRFALTE